MIENPKELLANIAPFGLRMQPELKDRVKTAAEGNNRSMNAEIIDRLERSFDPQGAINELLSLVGEQASELKVAEWRASVPASAQDVQQLAAGQAEMMVAFRKFAQNAELQNRLVSLLVEHLSSRVGAAADPETEMVLKKMSEIATSTPNLVETDSSKG